jgi:hypothetical protein
MNFKRFNIYFIAKIKEQKMAKKFMGVLLSLVLLICVSGMLTTVIVSCTSFMASIVGLPQRDKGYKISTSTPGENRAMAAFRGREYLTNEENKRSQTELRDPNYEGLPSIGYVDIMVRGRTIDTGNPKYWYYILTDNNGKELFRENGRDVIPKPETSQYGTMWEAIDIIRVDDSATEFPLTLRIVNQIQNISIDFTIAMAL